MIRAVLMMLRQALDEKRLAVRTDLSAKVHNVKADAGRFQQILLNLMSNALKFTPAGGSITIHTSDDDGALSIAIEDSGVGIDADVMPRLFNAFEQGEQTMSRHFGGLGLGLSIARSLAELHDGSISAFSAGRNKGATFTVRLPVAPETSARTAAASSTKSAPAKACRILLIEDHDDTRHVMEALLQIIGCTSPPRAQ